MVGIRFLADHTIGLAFGTLSSVCHLSSVICDVLYVAKRYVLAKNCLKEWIGNRVKKLIFGSPPYFYFWFCHYGHWDGRFCLIFACTAQQLVKPEVLFKVQKMARYASFCFIMSPFNHFTACMPDFSGMQENTACLSARIIWQILLHIVGMQYIAVCGISN